MLRSPTRVSLDILQTKLVFTFRVAPIRIEIPAHNVIYVILDDMSVNDDISSRFRKESIDKSLIPLSLVRDPKVIYLRRIDEVGVMHDKMVVDNCSPSTTPGCAPLERNVSLSIDKNN